MELVNEHLTRQLDIISPDSMNHRITIIGAGAIGSFTALSLAKMGFSDITVWDYDTVDTVNMNSQFYPYSAIGKYKVEALAKQIKEYANVEIKTISDKWTGSILPKGIVISAADCMSVRRKLFETNRFHTRFIDSRMGAEFAILHSFSPLDAVARANYEKTLHTNENGEQVPCTAKATVYTATLLAGMVVKNVKDIATGNDPIRTMFWDIANNGQEVYRDSLFLRGE